MRMSMAWLVLAVVFLASGALVAAQPAGTLVVGELTRLVYDIPSSRNPGSDARLDRVKAIAAGARDAAPGEQVPLPLTTAGHKRSRFSSRIYRNPHPAGANSHLCGLATK